MHLLDLAMALQAVLSRPVRARDDFAGIATAPVRLADGLANATGAAAAIALACNPC